MSTEQLADGWERIDWCNTAILSGQGASVEVQLDHDGISVDAEQGSGYMRERVTSFVPMSVLLRLLECAGYKVTPPSSGGSDK